MLERRQNGKGQMPLLRGLDEEVRQDEGGLPAVAMPGMRRNVHQGNRQHGQAAAAVPVVAAIGQDAGRAEREREDVQEEVRPLLGGLAGASGVELQIVGAA